jgi:purine-binding chemotaxis protein CheW
LVASTSKNADIQLVTFFLNGEEYGIDVMRVREITSMTEITRTANSPDYVKGIINLRGSIVPIISLRNRFGFADVVDDNLSFIAVMDFKGELTGFVIDEISDVIRIKQSDLQPPPIDNASQPWIEGILDVNQKLVVYLNLEHLA